MVYRRSRSRLAWQATHLAASGLASSRPSGTIVPQSHRCRRCRGRSGAPARRTAAAGDGAQPESSLSDRLASADPGIMPSPASGPFRTVINLSARRSRALPRCHDVHAIPASFLEPGRQHHQGICAAWPTNWPRTALRCRRLRDPRRSSGWPAYPPRCQLRGRPCHRRSARSAAARCCGPSSPR